MARYFFAFQFLYEFVVGAITLKRGFAHQAAAFDAPMVLRNRKRIFLPDLRHLHAGDGLAILNDEMRI